MLHDTDGIVQRVNPAALALLETPDPAYIVDKTLYSIIASEHEAAYRTLTEAAFGGEACAMSLELNTYRGRRRWLEIHTMPVHNTRGKVTGLTAVMRDLEGARRLTRELTEQRNRLHTIIDSEPECVKLQDRDGVIVEMNPAGLALLNADEPQQVIGRTVYEFLDPEYHDAYRDLTAAIFNGERHSMEFEVTTTLGRRRWLETHAAPLRDSSGSIIALLAITRDIDGRKRDEERLRQQQEELAHVCRLSTLGELASGIAHELNQPLCALSSYAESALTLQHAGSIVDKSALPILLNKIVAETGRASGIIDRLREYVRKQASRPRPNAVPVLIADVLNLVEAERRRRHIRIEVSAPDSLPDVNVDRVQAEQILINLLHNAIQALSTADPARQRIQITVDATRTHVTIRLRDFADGIAEPLRGQLFTPFFTTKENGLGMGLALSRSIAGSFGGQLRYRPEQPGSTFALTLPVADSEG